MQHPLTLAQSLDKDAGRLQRCQLMLGMLLNRANGQWAEQQAWSAPSMASVPDQDSWLASEQYQIYKADVLRKLRQGQVAVQVSGGQLGQHLLLEGCSMNSP